MNLPIVWMDLEMSGLNVERERILELAVLVTDKDLNVIAEGPELVVKQPDALLDGMDAWNTEHHGDSGLIERVKASTTTERDAELQLLAFLKEHVKEGQAPLAGNSIHQDRLFLKKYMPELEAYLHYRNLDVSTLKEIGRRWFPRQMAEAPRKKAQHRALADIQESIAELVYYRKAIMVAPDAPAEETDAPSQSSDR